MENFYGRLWSKITGSLPPKSKINSAFFLFSKKERAIFFGLVIVLVVSTLLILQAINLHFMVKRPMYGGSISEGIIGTPRFINPILANSPADQDLVMLIYSGLLRKKPDGSLVPDLASAYEISKDGLSYTFTLKDNIYFHDGQPVTVDDVIFTVNAIKDSVIKSPRKANWDGVAVSKIDEKNVRFTLRQPYAFFLENTTLGIMPAYLWNSSPVELNGANTNPVGSGPYMVSDMSKQASGVIDYYKLSAFDKFSLGKPFIKTISLHFYPNEESLIKGLEDKEVDQISSITPLNAEILKEEGFTVDSAVLPRVFGLFFNQSVNQVFTDKTVVKAIDQAIDKDRIVREVLNGYGVAIDNPIPPSIVEYEEINSNAKTADREEILQKVADSLAKDGWKKNADGILEKTTTEKKKKTTTPLEFSISTTDSPELSKAALFIQEDLAKLGMQVDIKTFDLGSLNQEVIRPRKYDALLFGQVINNESDLFAFWHSSQRKDPGLNIAMYTNAKVDKILEDAFVTVNKESRIKKYIQFEEEIKKDTPAVFLYTPNFIYVVSKSLKGLAMDHITYPSDRFRNIYSWYTEEYNVWKIFAH